MKKTTYKSLFERIDDNKLRAEKLRDLTGRRYLRSLNAIHLARYSDQ